MLPPGSATSVSRWMFTTPRNSPARRTVSQHIFCLQPRAAQMSVNEGFIFTNDGKTTYNDPDSGTLKFYLPAAAKGAVQGEGHRAAGHANRSRRRRRPRSRTSTRSISDQAGRDQFEVSYSVPYTTARRIRRQGCSARTGADLLVARNGVTLKGEGLEIGARSRDAGHHLQRDGAPTIRCEIAGTAAPQPPASDGRRGDSRPLSSKRSPPRRSCRA